MSLSKGELKILQINSHHLNHRKSPGSFKEASHCNISVGVAIKSNRAKAGERFSLAS